jgi:hypothetical protein
MPATPPPPPPPVSPPTSPQLYQQAVRNQERLQRNRSSPELRRVPSASTALSAIFPPPLPPPQPSVTFNGQSFNHLPSNIVAGIRNLQPFPTLSRRGCYAHPPPVCYLLLFSNNSLY